LFREITVPRDAPAVTIITLLKDEIFFLPAFLDHYRSLGVTQFVFLDDGSTDGSADYIKSQPDCALLVSDFSFGDTLNGKKLHVIWRTELARKYCSDRWGLVVDIDEFLELPPGFTELAHFTRLLDDQRCTAVGAVMVDFYPAHITDLEVTKAPSDKSELFARYPFFDDCPHGHWIDGRNKFQAGYGGVRDRLANLYGVVSHRDTEAKKGLRALKLKIRAFAGGEKRKLYNAIHKVPLVRWSQEYEYLSPHTLNRAPCSGLQLPLVHFKFTGSLYGKINSAIASRAYHRQSAEYRGYHDLLTNMKMSEASFLCDFSRKYVNSSDFLGSGILRVDKL
jgi:hypothetical protein